MVRRVVIRGKSYVSLEGVAECYRIEVRLIRDAYDLGLLGQGERTGSTTLIATSQLGRAAEIVRLHRYLGIDLPQLLAFLGDDVEAEGRW